MNGIKSLRRVARVSMCACVFTLAIPLGSLVLVGCGDTPPEGSTVKAGEGAQKDIDTMKNFMKSQPATPKK